MRSDALKDDGRPRAVRELRWEEFGTLQNGMSLGSRLRVPGGWLLATGDDACVFAPDPAHTWDMDHASEIGRRNPRNGGEVSDAG